MIEKHGVSNVWGIKPGPLPGVLDEFSCKESTRRMKGLDDLPDQSNTRMICPVLLPGSRFRNPFT